MSRGWRIGLGIAAFAVALNVVLALLHAVTGGTPGGPDGSSYATGARGAAAYATLLGRAGHDVTRLRRAPQDARLDPGATVVLLDAGGPVAHADAAALRSFVSAGGRLVEAGPAGAWLGQIVDDAPDWSPDAPRTLHTLAPDPSFAGVGTISESPYGSWQRGSALPLVGDDGRSLLSLAHVGAGRALLLANATPLENDRLARGDNAALGLALAGASRRPVVFLESFHGYGRSSSGLGAIPARWWNAFGLLAFAGAVLMVASGRRFGPPQRAERELPPPRRAYVEALGGVLARAKRGPEEALAPARRRIRQRLVERAGLASDAPPGELRRAAVALGVPEADADVLVRPAANDDDALSLARVLAQLERESR